MTAGPTDKLQAASDKNDPAQEQKKSDGDRVSPASERAAKLREQFKANADEFELYLGRHGYGDPKIDLQSIALHVSNRRFEPSVIGPYGKPIFKSARITKEQALKLIEVLD